MEKILKLNSVFPKSSLFVRFPHYHYRRQTRQSFWNENLNVMETIQVKIYIMLKLCSFCRIISHKHYRYVNKCLLKLLFIYLFNLRMKWKKTVFKYLYLLQRRRKERGCSEKGAQQQIFELKQIFELLNLK